MLDSWEDLNSQYNALMHSTKSCICLGLPNTLLFPLHLQFLCLFYHAFQCCNVIISSKQTIQLRLATNELCNFTNLPISSCTLGPNFLTTLVLNTFNLPSLNTRDQDCNINKWQVKLHITFLNHYVCIQERDR